MTILLALVTALVGAPPNTRLLVNADWLKQHQNDKNIVVLHAVFRADDYQKGHIPGALQLTWSDFVVQSETLRSELPPVEKLEATFERLGVSDNSTVIVYGDAIAAARAFMTLEYLGHRDVRLLDGGLPSWKAAGHEVTTDEVAPKAMGKLKPKVRDFVVDAEWVNANRTNPRYALIDARPLNEFTGSDEHEGMKGGHIPGAQNIYFTRFLKSREEPVLLPIAELQGLFNRAGATRDKAVIVYCMVGMRASVAYFVSRYLGYDTRFYDGSWVDWSAKGLPAVKGGEAVR